MSKESTMADIQIALVYAQYRIATTLNGQAIDEKIEEAMKTALRHLHRANELRDDLCDEIKDGTF